MQGTCIVPPIELDPNHGSLRRKIDKMLKQDVNGPATTKWANPIVLVAKKHGPLHFCVHYWKWNAGTVQESYLLPRRDECTNSLGRRKPSFRRWTGPTATGISETAQVTVRRLYLLAVIDFSIRGKAAWTPQCPCHFSKSYGYHRPIRQVAVGPFVFERHNCHAENRQEPYGISATSSNNDKEQWRNT